MKLTPRRRAILAAIVHHNQTQGYAPSMRDVGEVVGLVSTNTISYQVGVLRADGLLRPILPGQARSLRVLRCPATVRSPASWPSSTAPDASSAFPSTTTAPSPDQRRSVMSEPAPAEETTEVLAVCLTCYDTIVRDPDRATEVVEWEVTHREWAKDLAPTDRVLLVDYRLPDGTTGRHAFENPVAKVTVRVSGLFGAAA